VVQELVTRQVGCAVRHWIIAECLAKANEPPPIEKLSLKHTPKSDYKSQIELDLEQSDNKLRTVQLALEILTGACATLPDLVSSISTDENDEEDLEGTGVLIPIQRVNDFLDEDVEMDDDMRESMPRDETKRSSTALLPELVRPLLTLV